LPFLLTTYIVADQYRRLAGGALFFKILLHNVMASIVIIVSGVLIGTAVRRPGDALPPSTPSISMPDV
jgi:hypothetical protein